ncbi:hypothetical protein PAMA_021080 [Pampus argenteus]
MGCCSVTQRHTGVDEVGPDEIELLVLSGDNLGLGESRLSMSVRNSRDEQPQPPSCCTTERQLDQEVTNTVLLWGRSREELQHRLYSQRSIQGWEGQHLHMYGEIIHSSLVSLQNSCKRETTEHFLVLFKSHLLLLSLDHNQQDFVYEGILPLSGLSFQDVSVAPDASHSPHKFEISSPMMVSRVYSCPSAAELHKWKQCIEDRKYKSMMQPTSPSHCPLSYLLPCDEPWKKEELKTHLLQAPVWQWEGSPIQHMGQPEYISTVHIIDTLRQGLQERLMVLFPQDVLLLSVDNKRLKIRYEGRLARRSIKAVERSPERLEFELIGELVDPLQVSCSYLEDYQNWLFQLQQPDRSSRVTVSRAAPPIMPKLKRSQKESQEPKITDHRFDNNRRS